MENRHDIPSILYCCACCVCCYSRSAEVLGPASGTRPAFCTSSAVNVSSSPRYHRLNCTVSRGRHPASRLSLSSNSFYAVCMYLVSHGVHVAFELRQAYGYSVPLEGETCRKVFSTPSLLQIDKRSFGLALALTVTAIPKPKQFAQDVPCNIVSTVC